MKEWRWDRLRAHLLREGWFRPLWGVIRPAVVAIALALRLLLRDGVPPALGIGTLAAVALLEFATGRIRSPVWTQKAKAVVGFSAAMNVALATGVQNTDHAFLILLALPLAQPFIVAIALCMLWPLDTILKKRVLERAMRVRQADAGRTVIAVAGSVGKTTTKELLTCILAPRGAKATPAHVNTEMGVAAWLTKTLADPGLKQDAPLIIEMGAYRAGEIALLCRIAQPTIGVLTALGRDHLELFGSAEAIRDANAELLSALPPDGTAVVNGDDPACADAAKLAGCEVIAVSLADASDIQEDAEGLTFHSNETTFRVPVHGMHNIGNTLLAVAAAVKAGATAREAADALRTFRGMPHTFAVKEESRCTVLDDTYNSSPESMKAAFAWAAKQPHATKVLLTSGVMELGAAENTILEELGRTAHGIFSRVIFTTDAGRGAFAKGCGSDVELWSGDTRRIAPATLLVCIGRMPLTVITRVLPL